MTLSRNDLSANRELALRIIGEHCGSVAIGEGYTKDQPHFQPILDNTWEALADDGYICVVSNWHFKLTPSGWIKALEATGKFCDEQMKRDLGILSARLKRRVKGRKKPAVVGTDEIVKETRLQHYWVVNAISSHLLELCLKRTGADWAPDDENQTLIEVPRGFGHPLEIR
jgi:hypothetical protein